VGGIPDVNPKLGDFKGGAFQLAKAAKVPIVPMTFTNNHRLFSDPSFILGSAYPGFSHVHIHEYLSVEEIQQMDQKELMKYCFETINQPLLDEYPELKTVEN
jgi:1-acyl-sn-glycerol-3-phosphate acyltransferase